MGRHTRMIEILKEWIGTAREDREFSDKFQGGAENDALDAKIAENKKHLKHREDDDAKGS